jgi:F-type H+-transporting ATPase subunit a
MASETESMSVSYYIGRHLQNLTFGQHPDGSWGIAQTPEQAEAMGFMGHPP